MIRAVVYTNVFISALISSMGNEALILLAVRQGDEKFLACAKAAGVDFIVTDNKRHFPPRSCGTIRVVNAAELLDRITLEI